MKHFFMLLLVLFFSAGTAHAAPEGWQLNCTTIDSFTDKKSCAMTNMADDTTDQFSGGVALSITGPNRTMFSFQIYKNSANISPSNDLQIRIDQNVWKFKSDIVNGAPAMDIVHEMMTGQTLKFRMDGKVFEFPLNGFPKAWRQLVEDAGHDPLMANSKQTGI